MTLETGAARLSCLAMFDPSYSAALSCLSDFVPKAGRDYASQRNYDDIAHVSALSPYIRHRIITEDDVLRAVLARHSLQAAEKFVQEVYWRTYWKGWLEMRPAVWSHYRTERDAALNNLQTQSGLRQNWEAACKGETGIACFDHWAQQLVTTGYLHNHARMWFASIWIFTLRLPWTLGADFFLRHLLDGDPASNTLSWRWVAGVQTVGKTYLARPDNIAKYTGGRFNPTGLATDAPPLSAPPLPPKRPVPLSDRIDPGQPLGLLITEEDLSPGWLLDLHRPVATAIVQTTLSRSPLIVSDKVNDFVRASLKDCATRYGARLGPVQTIAPDAITAWAASNGVSQIVTSYVPTGPTADALAGVDLRQIIRPADANAWPFASHGFFRFKDNIPALVGQIKGLAVV